MIRKIGVAGAGTMGLSMAQIFARYGYAVTLYNHRAEKLTAAKEKIAAGVDTLVKAGDLTEAEGEETRTRIVYTAELGDLAAMDLVVENIAENMDIKHSFYRELSKIVPREMIIATNTSGLSIGRLAEAVEYPERFLGFHWLNPAHLIPLIEIIKSGHTEAWAAEEIYQLALSIKKKPVIIEKDVPGFGVNRLQMALVREALAMVQDGVLTAEAVDDILKYGLGFRWACLGPLETMDFGGLDIFYHVCEYLLKDISDSHEVPAMLADAFARGDLGVKTGKGFYTYEGDRPAEKTKERDQKLLKIYQALYGSE